MIAYGLFLGGFLLLGGRLGDLLGRRRIFLAGLAFFTGASLLAGLAQSAELLIGARALQGFGAALLAPSALSILAVTFAEGKERNGALGPLRRRRRHLGLRRRHRQRPADRRSRLAVGLLHQRPDRSPADRARGQIPPCRPPRNRSARQYDAAGATTVTGGLLLLVYGLNRGVDDGWGVGDDARALRRLRRPPGGLRLDRIPGHIARSCPFAALRNRTMVAADLAAFLMFGAFFSFIFLGSLLMQQHLALLPDPHRRRLARHHRSARFLAAAVTGARLSSAVGVKRLLIAGMSCS